MRIVAYCDGGSRGNPGPAGFGVYIQDSAGKALAELSEFLGTHTNNFAEYSALLAALEFAISMAKEPAGDLRFRADGETDEGPVPGEQPGAPSPLRGGSAPGTEARNASRFNMFCGRRTGMRTGWRTWPWTVAWAGRRLQAGCRPPPAPKAAMLRGFVKGGVVHVLGGDLPDGIFVKVIPE